MLRKSENVPLKSWHLQASFEWRGNLAQSHLTTFPGLQLDTSRHHTLHPPQVLFTLRERQYPPRGLSALQVCKTPGVPALSSGFAGPGPFNCPKLPLLPSWAVSCCGDTVRPLLCQSREGLLTQLPSHYWAATIMSRGPTAWGHWGHTPLAPKWGGQSFWLVPLRWAHPALTTIL